jgi:hypothetical protein
MLKRYLEETEASPADVTPPIQINPRDWIDVTRILQEQVPALEVWAFDTSDLPIRVDVVDWAATSATFRKIITQDKVVVQHLSQC